MTQPIEQTAPALSTGGRLWPGGFRNRMLLSLIAVVLLTAGLVGGLAYWRFQDTLNHDLQSELESYTSTIAQAVVVSRGEPSLDPSRLASWPQLGKGRFRVVQGERVFYEIGGRFPDNLTGWISTRRALEGGFVLEGALDPSQSREALQAFIQTELLALPLALGLALAVAYLLFSYLMRPIRALTEATYALAQQRFPEPLPIPPGGDELADLARSFNRMSEAVRSFLERERSFSRYTSHELRTPLATLRAQIEALEQGLLPQQETLPAIKSSLGRLERLLAGLIALTRTPQTEPGRVRIGSVVTLTLDSLPPQWRGRVRLVGDLEASILGYEEPLQQAVGNLLHNALKFSQKDVWLEICQGEQIIIAVRDEGPGVPEDTLARLGSPFFRLQPKTEGIGLGLALVRHVALMLGGQLEFGNRVGGGLEAQLILPKPGVGHVA